MPSASSARPPTADFASVMGIGYHPTDSFRWHTDMAGDDGWVLSISLGAAATFEYLPRSADPTRLCALALAEDTGVRRLYSLGYGGYSRPRLRRMCARAFEGAWTQM